VKSRPSVDEAGQQDASHARACDACQYRDQELRLRWLPDTEDSISAEHDETAAPRDDESQNVAPGASG
jgi:hypothetical protein